MRSKNLLGLQYICDDFRSMISIEWILIILILPFLLILTSCSNDEDQSGTQMEANALPVVEVIATDYAFQAPDTISSGWTTLRFTNGQNMEIHELGLARLPNGKNLGDYLSEIMPPWESALNQLQSGEIEASEIGAVAYEMLPDWNSDIEYIKSRGLISAGHQSENIMKLEPGTYMIECWVKNADGEIHIIRGMIRALTVIDTGNTATAPEADYQISLTEQGINTSAPIGEGFQTISVDFELNDNDQLFYDDVHLIRADDQTDFTSINEWLGWYQVGGLRAPAPAEFLGGTDVYGSLPEGRKAYFSVNIESGDYAWVVHSPMGEPVFERFTVE